MNHTYAKSKNPARAAKRTRRLARKLVVSKARRAAAAVATAHPAPVNYRGVEIVFSHGLWCARTDNVLQECHTIGAAKSAVDRFLNTRG
jgi:hypothetical protein